MTAQPPRKIKTSSSLFSPSQANRLRIGCEHIDELLGDIEIILESGSSSAAFPKYIPDIPPVRQQCIHDYISQIRTRLIQILQSTNVSIDQPDVTASKAASTRLLAILISIDDLRPKAMKGYGPISPEGEAELNGIVGETQALVKQLYQFITDTGGQNITERLNRLQQEGSDLTVLSRIEEVVSRQGMVEFRGMIASILDRAEDNQFEIAVFGRVSSGKSSLLNAILETDILPVGVTPVTALPIHISQGEKSSIIVSFADRDPVATGVEHLPEYATEQENPANIKRVSRIRITFPSLRLKEGVGFVDTPGLGSLATSGAAETRAYLPNADLGIVLIDSGSTLTAEDLSTILALQEAAVPVHVLISKADLLSGPDTDRLTMYVSDQIISRCGERYLVWPVSVQQSHRHLLDQWYSEQILPLSAQARALKKASLQRKIGLLKETVISALESRAGPVSPLTPEEEKRYRRIESSLRKGNALIEETRSTIRPTSEQAFGTLSPLWNNLVPLLADRISGTNGNEQTNDTLIRQTIMRFVQGQTRPVHDQVFTLAENLEVIIGECSSALEREENTEDEPFTTLIRDMPVFDPGDITLTFSLPVFSSILGRSYLERTVKDALVKELKQPLTSSLNIYTRQLLRWSEQVIRILEKRYENTSARYRANLVRFRDRTGHTAEETRNIGEEIALLTDR